ncbi:Uncharacterised protein [Mycobacteroides abscessus subsp. abscessus]|nr:Uncharacterised protein [Mycobacteroides abscessus subsp. abscessus]
MPERAPDLSADGAHAITQSHFVERTQTIVRDDHARPHFA